MKFLYNIQRQKFYNKNRIRLFKYSIYRKETIEDLIMLFAKFSGYTYLNSSVIIERKYIK